MLRTSPKLRYGPTFGASGRELPFEVAAAAAAARKVSTRLLSYNYRSALRLPLLHLHLRCPRRRADNSSSQAHARKAAHTRHFHTNLVYKPPNGSPATCLPQVRILICAPPVQHGEPKPQLARAAHLSDAPDMASITRSRRHGRRFSSKDAAIQHEPRGHRQTLDRPEPAAADAVACRLRQQQQHCRSLVSIGSAPTPTDRSSLQTRRLTRPSLPVWRKRTTANASS